MSRWRQWLESVLQRMGLAGRADSEQDLRTAQARTRFWKEFRAGQAVADERMAAAERPQPVTR
jgi:hypothetical protein